MKANHHVVWCSWDAENDFSSSLRFTLSCSRIEWLDCIGTFFCDDPKKRNAIKFQVLQKRVLPSPIHTRNWLLWVSKFIIMIFKRHKAAHNNIIKIQKSSKANNKKWHFKPNISYWIPLMDCEMHTKIGSRVSAAWQWKSGCKVSHSKGAICCRKHNDESLTLKDG